MRDKNNFDNLSPEVQEDVIEIRNLLLVPPTLEAIKRNDPVLPTVGNRLFESSGVNHTKNEHLIGATIQGYGLARNNEKFEKAGDYIVLINEGNEHDILGRAEEMYNFMKENNYHPGILGQIGLFAQFHYDIENDRKLVGMKIGDVFTEAGHRISYDSVNSGDDELNVNLDNIAYNFFSYGIQLTAGSRMEHFKDSVWKNSILSRLEDQVDEYGKSDYEGLVNTLKIMYNGSDRDVFQNISNMRQSMLENGYKQSDLEDITLFAGMGD